MRTAYEFPSEEALQGYLRDHPGANRSNHYVRGHAPAYRPPPESTPKHNPPPKHNYIPQRAHNLLFRGSSDSRVAARYMTRLAASAPLDPKMRELFEAIRKRPERALTPKALLAVLNILGGWKVEKVVGLIKIYGYRNDGKDTLYYPDDPVKVAEFEAEYARVKAHAVKTLPTSGIQPGQTYYKDLSPIRPADVFGKKGKEFTSEGWIGEAGLRFTSPEGKVCDELPRASMDAAEIKHAGHMVVDRFRLRAWMIKETQFIAQINAALNTTAYVPKAYQRREGSGTCPACFGYYMFRPKGAVQAMVLHGYERPGWGYIHGRCFGVGHQPYELSKEGTVAFQAAIRQWITAAKKELVNLKTQKKFWYDKKDYTPDVPGFESVRKTLMAKKVRDIEGLNHDLELCGKYIRDWKPQPLGTVE